MQYDIRQQFNIYADSFSDSDLTNTVKPLLSGPLGGSALWPLNRGTQKIDSGRINMFIFNYKSQNTIVNRL